MKLFSKYALALLWSSVLAGCGGGGGSGAETAPPVERLTIPLSTVIANYVNQSYSSSADFSGAITSSGQTVTVTGSGTTSEQTQSGTFEGSPALKKTMTVTGTLSGNGQTVPLASTSVAYFSSNYQPLGTTSANGYCVTTSASPLPAFASVGDTGVWYTENCYDSSAKQTVLATGSYSYAIEPDTATTALFKLLAIVTVNGVSLPAVATWRVTNTGAITRLSETTGFASGGDSVTLTATYR